MLLTVDDTCTYRFKLTTCRSMYRYLVRKTVQCCPGELQRDTKRHWESLCSHRIYGHTNYYVFRYLSVVPGTSTSTGTFMFKPAVWMPMYSHATLQVLASEGRTSVLCSWPIGQNDVWVRKVVKLMEKTEMESEHSPHSFWRLALWMTEWLKVYWKVIIV